MSSRINPAALGVATAVLSGLVSGCDVMLYTQTQRTPEVVVSVTVDPHPLHTGSTTEIYVTLRRERAGASGCRVRYMQYPKGAMPADDSAWRDVPERSPAGVHRIRSAPFEQAGPWEFKFGVKCLGQEHMLIFDYNVE